MPPRIRSTEAARSAQGLAIGFWAFLAIGLLAGCQSAPKPTPHLIPLHSAPAVPPTPATNGPAIATPAPVAPPPTRATVEVTNPPVVRAPVRLVPALPAVSPDVWVSLDRFCETSSVARPKLAHENASRTYALPTPDGPALLTAGQRVVTVAGTEVWLGYPPRLTNQTLYVHQADAQRSILPLALNSTRPKRADWCVVIDPGHGGRSPGTSNIVTGVYEKDYTLDWAKRVRQLLQTNGWKVVLTRTNDDDVAISNRIALADLHHADLFVSLHFNSAGLDADPRRERRGLVTYCLTPAGLPSSLRRDPEEDQLWNVFANHAFDCQNLQYALKCHRSLLKTTGLLDLGVQRARFLAVLRGQNRPAILIEGGFLSNPVEAKRIADPRFRQKLAEGVARALIE